MSTGIEAPGATSSPSDRSGTRRVGIIARIINYVRQVVSELRKVIWPSRPELITYTTVVLAFVAVMMLIVSAFDFAFSQAVIAVFGK